MRSLVVILAADGGMHMAQYTAQRGDMQQTTEVSSPQFAAQAAVF
jgi:hypothetical protein